MATNPTGRRAGMQAIPGVPPETPDTTIAATAATAATAAATAAASAAGGSAFEHSAFAPAIDPRIAGWRPGKRRLGSPEQRPVLAGEPTAFGALPVDALRHIGDFVQPSGGGSGKLACVNRGLRDAMAPHVQADRLIARIGGQSEHERFSTYHCALLEEIAQLPEDSRLRALRAFPDSLIKALIQIDERCGPVLDAYRVAIGSIASPEMRYELQEQFGTIFSSATCRRMAVVPGQPGRAAPDLVAVYRKVLADRTALVESQADAIGLPDRLAGTHASDAARTPPPAGPVPTGMLHAADLLALRGLYLMRDTEERDRTWTRVWSAAAASTQERKATLLAALTHAVRDLHTQARRVAVLRQVVDAVPTLRQAQQGTILRALDTYPRELTHAENGPPSTTLARAQALASALQEPERCMSLARLAPIAGMLALDMPEQAIHTPEQVFDAYIDRLDGFAAHDQARMLEALATLSDAMGLHTATSAAISRLQPHIARLEPGLRVAPVRALVGQIETLVQPAPEARIHFQRIARLVGSLPVESRLPLIAELLHHGSPPDELQLPNQLTLLHLLRAQPAAQQAEVLAEQYAWLNDPVHWEDMHTDVDRLALMHAYDLLLPALTPEQQARVLGEAAAAAGWLNGPYMAMRYEAIVGNALLLPTRQREQVLARVDAELAMATWTHDDWDSAQRWSTTTPYSDIERFLLTADILPDAMRVNLLMQVADQLRRYPDNTDAADSLVDHCTGLPAALQAEIGERLQAHSESSGDEGGVGSDASSGESSEAASSGYGSESDE